MIRSELLKTIESAFKSFPIVELLGPRQSGKTTLSLQYSDRLKNLETNYFDLEKPTDVARLQNPQITLEALSGLIVIDEIQRMPELFPVLRYLADRRKSKTKFLILGSASLELIKNSSESLAGRVKYINVRPFDLVELDFDEKLWIRGGFPKSYLAKSDQQSFEWREEYVRTFLERDIPALGINLPAHTMSRFWMMLSHYHGQVLNLSELSRSFGVSDHTVKRYLDILSGTFMVRQLQPWFQNISKRQIKSSKIYFNDSGVFHYFLDIHDKKALLTNPKLGASWEGFAINSLISIIKKKTSNVYFWGIHSQAELDLFCRINGKPTGFEVKYIENPKITNSMKVAINALKLNHLYIVYPGKNIFKLHKNITVLPIRELNTFFKK